MYEDQENQMPRPKKYLYDRRMIHVRLSEETHKLLRVLVAELDTTMQDWIRLLVERELKKRLKKK